MNFKKYALIVVSVLVVTFFLWLWLAMCCVDICQGIEGCTVTLPSVVRTWTIGIVLLLALAGLTYSLFRGGRKK